MKESEQADVYFRRQGKHKHHLCDVVDFQEYLPQAKQNPQQLRLQSSTLQKIFRDAETVTDGLFRESRYASETLEKKYFHKYEYKRYFEMQKPSPTVCSGKEGMHRKRWRRSTRSCEFVSSK
jgi:hypothetical protein